MRKPINTELCLKEKKMHHTKEMTKKRKQALFDEMSAESDRGCILVGASVLEEMLDELLKKTLSIHHHSKKHAVEPLFGVIGPLSTFSAKIKLAYALDAFPQWCFEDLEKIRRIRNSAAHEYSSKTFENPEIICLSSTLVGADYAVASLPSSEVPNEGHNIDVTIEPTSQGPCETPMERARFIFTVNYIAGLLTGLIIARGVINASKESQVHNQGNAPNPKSVR
jgi:DNA-binding MltR family transcriptional regulator